MHRSVAAILGSLIVLVFLLTSLREKQHTAGEGTPQRGHAAAGARPPLVVYCAASNRAVMDAVRDDYQREYGTEIQVQYGASQTLLAAMEVSGTGDLYLPADESYAKLAQSKQLVEEVLPVARMQAVIAVPRGNPRQIQQFSDLLKDDVRTVQVNPDAGAIGKLTREVLSGSGLWESLASHTAAYRSTITDVANDVKVGAADAGIVFDAVLHTYPELEAVQIDELRPVHADVMVCVISGSDQPERALHFARYLSARDRGLKRYAEFGFQPLNGDVWEDVPELTLFAGSMLRPAIERTIQEFEKREGVRVTRVFNGCGILVAQMRAGQHPDAYFACDREFMSQVHDLFPHPVDVSQNELVILVPKGNPQGISSLQDLTRPGLRVGIGHEKQCAMGWLTQRTLQEGGVQTDVMKNVTVQSPSGDMLVNQMHAGALDAAVVYLSNAAGSADSFDAVQILGLPCSQAVQPFAVAEDSPHKQLMSRLYARLTSAASRERFQQEGFRWELKAAAGIMKRRPGETP